MGPRFIINVFFIFVAQLLPFVCIAKPITVYSPVPVDHTELGKMCLNLTKKVAAQTLKDQGSFSDEDWSVWSIEETYNFKRPATEQYDEHRIKISRDLLNAKERNGQPIATGHDIYGPSSNPFRHLDSMLFGVRINQQEFRMRFSPRQVAAEVVETAPGVFESRPNAIHWVWFAENPIRVDPDLIHANCFSKNVRPYNDIQHLERASSSEVVHKISKYDTYYEILGLPHDSRGNGIQFSSDVDVSLKDPEYYAVFKPGTDEKVGYLVSHRFRYGIEHNNNEAMYRGHFGVGSSSSLRYEDKTYLYEAHFDLEGNRIEAWVEENAQVPAGTLLSKLETTRTSFVTEGGMHTERSPSKESLAPPPSSLVQGKPIITAVDKEYFIPSSKISSSDLIKMWNKVTDKLEVNLLQYKNVVTSPNGRMRFFSKGNDHFLVDADTNETLRTFHFPRAVLKAQISRNGKELFLRHEDGWLRGIEISSGKKIFLKNIGRDKDFYALPNGDLAIQLSHPSDFGYVYHYRRAQDKVEIFAKDARVLAAGSHHIALNTKNSSVNIKPIELDPSNEMQSSFFPIKDSYVSKSLISIAKEKDVHGRTLMAMGIENYNGSQISLQRFDGKDCKWFHSISADGKVTGMNLSDDGRLLAVATSKSLSVWSLENEVTELWNIPSNSYLGNPEFLAEGSLLQIRRSEGVVLIDAR